MRDSALSGYFYDKFKKEDKLGNLEVASCLKHMSDALDFAYSNYVHSAKNSLQNAETCRLSLSLPSEYLSAYRRAYDLVVKLVY